MSPSRKIVQLVTIALLLLNISLFIEASTNLRFGDSENNDEIENNRQLRAPPTAIEVAAMKKLKPLKTNEFIMFWRPQKVGSSTILSILMSYGYRYNVLPRRKTTNNAFCKMIGYCSVNNPHYKKDLAMMQKLQKLLWGGQKAPDRDSSVQAIEQQIRSISVPFQMSLTHELCNFDAYVLQQHLQCAFDAARNVSNRVRSSSTASVPVKELFLVREPLSRAVSVYYFWGELFKLAHERKTILESKKKSKKQVDEVVPVAQLHLDEIKLGKNVPHNKSVDGNLFRYHGDEGTVPPADIALKFATAFPFRAGMPGPSFTWSAFASSPQDAIARIMHADATANPLVTLVLERLDESLIVLRHAFGWSLADVVTIMPRKALSSHPKHPAWPKEAVGLLRTKLNNTGEFAVYHHSVEMLNRNLRHLEKDLGVNVRDELVMLKELRSKAAQICLANNGSHLHHYRIMMQLDNLQQHPARNKLRDVEEFYIERGHVFSFNLEILGSFDVCGSCEAHALLAGLEFGLAKTVANSTALFALPADVRAKKGAVFQKCPLKQKKPWALA